MSDTSSPPGAVIPSATTTAEIRGGSGGVPPNLSNALQSARNAVHNPYVLLFGIPIVIILAGTRIGPIINLGLLAVLVKEITFPPKKS